MTTDTGAGQSYVGSADGRLDPHRLRDGAAALWRASAAHQARAVELELAEGTDWLYRARVQRDLAEVVAQHAMAHQELAVAVDARNEAACHPEESAEWAAAFDRAGAALRRAEAHYQRAGSVAARIAGRNEEQRRHHQAACATRRPIIG
ncbi:hypothetical protein [Amycolatopsis tolypomycina]|uniref:hypothetical protein n=1 Tax=Amycolatopsis tolypomycina TaxID=208445 RepID=UPI0033A3446E